MGKEKTENLKTGYPSIDKPWLKYYPSESINAELPQGSIYDVIWNNNQDNLKRCAIKYYKNQITYRNFFDHIDNVAAALVNLQIKRGDIVTICMLNSPETIFLIYALNKIGAVANLISGLDSDKEIIEHIGNATSEVLFTIDLFAERIKSIIDRTSLRTIVVSNLTQTMSVPIKFAARTFKKMSPKRLPKDGRFVSWENFISHKNNTAINWVSNSEDAAVICYTGGTTGGSKGVVLSNRSIIAVAQQYIWRGKKVSRDSHWVNILPSFIAYGITCSIQIPLMIGMTMDLHIVGSAKIGELLKSKPQYIVYGPAFWEAFVNENNNMDLSFLIAAVSGGDRLPEPVEEKTNKYLLSHGCKSPILNGYGMTEVGAAVSANFLGAYQFGSVGIPFVKTIISAFDVETGEELPAGVEGELCIHTPSMMTEYINDPEETKSIMRKHSDGKVWIHSGDLGYVDKNGFVYISGRLKRYMLIKYNNIYKKVFSLDIEKVLLTHSAVNNCAVVPMEDETAEQVPRAFIILKENVKLTDNLVDDIKSYCERHLDSIYCPNKYEFVKHFPLTKIGKVDYKALEKE